MEQEFAEDAVDIEDPDLIEHIIAKTDLVPRFEKTRGVKFSLVAETTRNDFLEFVQDEIKSEAICVESFDRVVEMYGEEESFPHMVMEFQGIYFYQSMDYDDVGYWLDRQNAVDHAAAQADL